MKVRLKFPPQGEKDNFSHDLGRADWLFKFFGCIVLIGTLQYAGNVTGHTVFTAWAFFLTLEICYLASSFVNNRIEIEIVHSAGKRPFLRSAINIIFAAAIGFAAWEGASYFVRMGVNEIIEFSKRGR